MSDEKKIPIPRYKPLGNIQRENIQPSVAIHMCLRCGAVVVAMETARHDLDHLVANGGSIPDEEWALIDRPPAV